MAIRGGRPPSAGIVVSEDTVYWPTFLPSSEPALGHSSCTCARVARARRRPLQRLPDRSGRGCELRLLYQLVISHLIRTYGERFVYADCTKVDPSSWTTNERWCTQAAIG